MPLFIIGLGLGDEEDITVKGARLIRSSDRVWLESYTSVLGVSTERLEATYGKKIEVAYRETVESESDKILLPARECSVAFLVVGDPFGATTHTDLVLRAHAMGIETKIVHNASIMNAAGASGLQLYSFGATVSIPYFREEWRPDSFYDRIVHNVRGGLHTLCLLDIKVREPNFETLTRTGRLAFDPPRFMSVAEAIDQLLEVEVRRGGGVCGPQALGVGLARVGQDSQCIVSGTLEQLRSVDFGAPLHSLVLVGDMHDLERDMFEHFRVKSAGRAADATAATDAAATGGGTGSATAITGSTHP